MSSVAALRRCRNWLTPFVIGFTAEQTVTFVKEGGLNNPFTRSLFIIVLGVAFLIFLWGSESLDTMKERVEVIETNQAKAKKTNTAFQITSVKY
jgi:hypothetical protein